MSQPQEQRHKPHCMWAKTQATHIGASSVDNLSSKRDHVMPMQVSSGLSPSFSNDIQVAAASATAKAMEHRVLLSPQPPPSSVSPKKGTSWTEKEHKLFLIGLEKYGKGDWKSISRFSVRSKNPCQVASHAQKYFLRQSLPAKKRKSIHDITLEETDHTLLSRSIDNHNSVPLPQNQYVDITLEESNHQYTDHQNWVAPSQNQYLDISPQVSEQALVPHYTDHQNWVAPSQNQCLHISPEMSNHQHTDHQKWVAPSQNQCLPISPERSNHHYTDHQNWVAPSQNQCLHISPERSNHQHTDHQNWVAPSHNQCLHISSQMSNHHFTDQQNWVAPSQNQCLHISPERSNHQHTDHQNWVAPSQNQCLHISSQMSNHHFTDQQNWVAPSQNQCLHKSSERSNHQHTDHQNWFSPSQNQCHISPEVSNQVLLPHYIDNQNWIATSQNQCLDIASDVSNLALDPRYTYHQNRLAPFQSLDTTTMRFAPIPHISDHQTSIISPQICDLPSQNGTYGMDLELLQAQQTMSSLPPNNLPPQPIFDEYQYQYHLDRLNSLESFKPIR